MILHRAVDFLRLFHDVPGHRTIFLRSEYDRFWPPLSRLARSYRRMALTRTRIAVVVGSLGKTTTKRALDAALGCPERNFSYSNYGSSLAENLLRIRPWDTRAVLEAGVNGPGQMAPYANMVRPDLVIVTSIKSEHNRSFPTLLDTREEKVRMVRALEEEGTAILNGDDPHVRWMVTQTRARIVTFGLGTDNDVQASEVRTDGGHTAFDVHLDGVTHTFQSKLLGDHMVYPVLAALATAHAEKIDVGAALDRLAQLRPTASRMELIYLADGTRILDDSYKAALESVHAAFDTFSRIPGARKIVVLGNVQEPPGRAGDIYRDLGTRLARFADVVICVGGNNMKGVRMGATRAGMDHSAIRLAGSRIRDAMAILRETLRPGDLVLVKGASGQKLRRVVLKLLERNVSCGIKQCGVKVRSCDACPLLEAPESSFENPFISRYIQP